MNVDFAAPPGSVSELPPLWSESGCGSDVGNQTREGFGTEYGAGMENIPVAKKLIPRENTKRIQVIIHGFPYCARFAFLRRIQLIPDVSYS